MTRSFTTITVVAAMLMPAEALPREATLLNFPVIQDAKFVLLEPGSPGLSDELQSKQSSEDLNHDFQSFGYKAAVFETPRESIGHVQIPRWMRAPQILNIPRRSPSNWSMKFSVCRNGLFASSGPSSRCAATAKAIFQPNCDCGMRKRCSSGFVRRIAHAGKPLSARSSKSCRCYRYGSTHARYGR